MVTAVRLQVEGVDLDDDLTNELLAEHFPDFLWSSVDGLVTMTVYAPEADVVCHVTDAARRVEHVVKGADVRRVHRDLVTQSDIAFRVGVSREAVRKWTHRSGDKPFPAPFDTVGGGDTRPSKVWQWSDVAAWLNDAYYIDMDEHLPDAETVAHIDACLAKVNGYLEKEWHTVTAAAELTVPTDPTRVRAAIVTSVFEAHLEAVREPAAQAWFPAFAGGDDRRSWLIPDDLRDRVGA